MTGLLLDQKTIEEDLGKLRGRTGPDRLEKFLELAANASLSYELALPEEKREMVNIVTSNRLVDGKNLYLKPSIPFQQIANRPANNEGDPKRATPRTLDEIIDDLTKLNAAGQLPDLSAVCKRHAEPFNYPQVFGE